MSTTRTGIGRNEFTTETEDTLVIRLHETDIITVDMATQTATIDTGGWNSLTTMQHLRDAFIRLRRRFPWFPSFHTHYGPDGQVYIYPPAPDTIIITPRTPKLIKGEPHPTEDYSVVLSGAQKKDA